VASAAQPTAVVVTVFGSTSRVDGALRGDIYMLDPDTTRLPNFAALTPVGSVYATQIDIAPRRFSEGFPGVSDRFEWFAVRYAGNFEISRPGRHHFRLLSDDGARLSIDGELAIDNDGVHPPQSREADVNLGAGTHAIVLEYFQGPRYEIALQLFMTRPGGAEEVFSTR
jgi:hypothetical protein